MLVDLWAALADLVLPTECAGCRRTDGRLRFGVCVGCVDEVRQLRPRAVRPDPAPAGLPDCVALGAYAGVLRELLLAYKERGRHGLARPLGRLLAATVAAAVDPRQPVLLVPVPSTAAAVRERHGDHLRRLTRHAVTALRADGWRAATARPLRALPRPDSAGLDSAGRMASAEAGFAPRRVGFDVARRRVGFDVARRRVGFDVARRRVEVDAAGRRDSLPKVIVVDDIVTTGATLAAVERLLAAEGLAVHTAVVLAATRRRDGA
ncbi:ComF family protein [Micromonospora sp. LOL_023]|uniref:ComF family protein n=1 Tax=Micromonospora sp. LOL_023 TaxID=3345418 RepID=UPI003A84BBB6